MWVIRNKSWKPRQWNSIHSRWNTISVLSQWLHLKGVWFSREVLLKSNRIKIDYHLVPFLECLQCQRQRFQPKPEIPFPSFLDSILTTLPCVKLCTNSNFKSNHHFRLPNKIENRKRATRMKTRQKGGQHDTKKIMQILYFLPSHKSYAGFSGTEKLGKMKSNFIRQTSPNLNILWAGSDAPVSRHRLWKSPGLWAGRCDDDLFTVCRMGAWKHLRLRSPCDSNGRNEFCVCVMCLYWAP